VSRFGILGRFATGYKFRRRMASARYSGVSGLREEVIPMRPFAFIGQMASRLREFFAPSYRPELHYMRGPGPACARVRAKTTRR
jgi:hypothetical protein